MLQEIPEPLIDEDELAQGMVPEQLPDDALYVHVS